MFLLNDKSVRLSRVTVYDSDIKLSLWSYILKSIRELFIYRFAFYDLVSTALKRRYRRSVLGFFWALVNPLLNLSIIALVFSVIFREDLQDFGRYVFSGLVPWTFISNSFTLGCQSIVAGEGYLKKVYLPKLIFPLVAVSAEAINFMLSIVSIYLIFLVIGAQLHPVMLLLPLAVLITYLFALGAVIILSIVNVYFRDTVQLTQVFLTALFYSVPVLFPIDMVPAQFLPLIKINPLYQYLNLFRNLLFELTAPTLSEWLIPLSISLGVLALGLTILKQKENDIIFRL